MKKCLEDNAVGNCTVGNCTVGNCTVGNCGNDVVAFYDKINPFLLCYHTIFHIIFLIFHISF